MKNILLSIAFAVPFLMNAQTIVASENFDSYAADDLLTDVGEANGWREWGNGTGYSAVVTAASASSGTLAGRSASDGTYDSDAIFQWADATTGKFTIEFKLYIPVGSAGGYIGVGDSDMDDAGGQANALYIMGDSLLLMSDDAAYFAQAPLIPNTWIAIKMVIDLEEATAELLVDGSSYGVGNATYVADGIPLGGLDLWGTNIDVTVDPAEYNPGDYYYDDIVVTEVNPQAGIEENTLRVSVSPNPAASFLNFNLEEELKGVQIYSLDGREVISSNSTSINVEALFAGTYIYKIETLAGNLASGKFIKR
ncbi:MAG: hypothetical protein ACI9G9_001088 [Psychromonas sp.]|jgi:hypothetical protein